MNPDRSMRDRSTQLDLIDWPDGICAHLARNKSDTASMKLLPNCPRRLTFPIEFGDVGNWGLLDVCASVIYASVFSLFME